MNEDRLTALDAGFLQTEDSDDHANLAIAALAVLDGPAPDFADLQAAIEDRSGSITRCRQILHTHTLDLSAPQWISAPTFDIAHHVRRLTVGRPGGDEEVFHAVADVMERRLDRSRPLWEVWMMEGLADDKWALLIKLHHCIADGISATAMLTSFCDDVPAATSASKVLRIRHQPAPRSALRLINPVTLGTEAWRTLTSTARTGIRAATGAAQIVAGILIPSQPPSGGLNGQLTDLRRFSAARVSLDDVELVGERFGATVNDVVLAAITDGFRTAMLQRGIAPSSGPIRTLVPVSVRSADALHVPDNRVSILLPDLPVDQDDPLEQLRLVHKRLATAKGSGQRQAGTLVLAAANLVPFPIMASAVRLLGRLPQRGIVAVATNVPGPQHHVQVLGRQVVELVPIPPIAVGMRTGIAVMSYAGALTFGVIGDYDAKIGAEDLARGIEHGMTRLVDVATAAQHTRRSGNLLLLSG